MKGLWLKTLQKHFSPNSLGYMSLLGGFLIQLTLGSLYTYGNMAPYIIQYMNTTNPPGTITVGNSMWIFGLAVFGLGASMSLGGFIENRLGPISTILIGCSIMSFGVIITSVTIKVHLALTCLSYGLLTGIGSGIAYGVSLAIPSEWFPNSKGLVSGIIVAGFGLGSMVFDFLQSWYINPNPKRVELKDPSKVPSSFLIFGSAYAVMQLIGAFIITHPSKDSDKSPDKQARMSLEMFIDELETCNDVNISPHELIYELDFWILWMTYAMNSVVAILVLSLHKVFGQSLGITDNKLVYASALGSLFNGVGRVFWGFFNDRINYKILMSVLTTSMAVMLGTFYICTVLNGEHKYAFYIFWVILLHLILSGSFTLFPAICVKTFGVKNFAENYGMLFTAYSFSGILTSSLTSGLLQKPYSNNYLVPFLIGAGFSLLAALITMFYRGRSLLYRNLST